ncbi:MAG: hypothetical protein A2Y95_03400 [Deltaproteobacteria bacterium RBG_13_65_10]|nr:MAG: hypothetical protein A2Y95_03400 [Deltaproteobacteria bacterium RBG_13_65_10]
MRLSRISLQDSPFLTDGSPREAKASTRCLRILLVDDDALNLVMLREHLTPHGYDLIEAHNGEEALERARTENPDLVVLDVVMPGLDGLEVCRRIKAGQGEHFLPVILITARGDTGSKVEGLGCGADDYVTKPFHPDELLARIESMLRIKRLEDNLAQEKRRVEIEKEKLERVIGGMHDAVITVTPQGEISLNPSAEVILAPQAKDGPLAYLDICRVLAFDPLLSALNTLPKKAGAEEDSDALVREITLGDSTYGAITSKLPFPEHGGEGAIVVLRNMTKEKEVERIKNEFVSFVSHELRTPLTSIKNSISILLSGKTGALSSDAEKFLGIANRNALRLAALIDDLLDLSRIEAGRLELNFARCSVGKSIESSLGCLASQAEAKHIVIQREIPLALPPIHGDAKKIEQVVTNLVGNAIKFTSEGGRITVSATSVDTPPANVPPLPVPADSYIQVNVEDTGIGIPPDHLERIFDKFHQVRQAQSSGGTGLGLAIVKSFVAAHGGTIWAESEPSQWSRFSFLLPVFSQENLYHFALHSGVDRAKRAQNVLSVIGVRLEAGVSARTKDGLEMIEETFSWIVGTIEKNLYKPNDLAFPLPTRREIRVLLPDTPKRDAMAVLRRLEQVLHPILWDDTEPAPPIAFSVCSYPDDGLSAPELEFYLSENAGSLKIRGTGDLSPEFDPFSEL